ncbi:MAG: TonB-dependent receptor [Steroidobacteraceae bacterium]
MKVAGFSCVLLTFALAPQVRADVDAVDAGSGADTSPGATIEEVVVSSRNRQESAQDVPLPLLVIGADTLEREDIKSVWDLPAKAPNLQLNPPGENARKVSPSIRGLGRGGANDSMEQSVGVIVDGVTLYYSGQAWADYVDLDRIEVLRGPQGTLMGKNTTLGAINIVTKAPSFEPASSYEISTGDLNKLSGKFSSTGSLIDDVLAYRGTFLVDRVNGIYTNTYQSMGHSKETWRESNKIAGRLQLLWKPTDTLTGRFIVDDLRSDERVNTGNVLVSNGPATYADGTARATYTPIDYTPTGSYANYGYLGKFAERSAWFHNADGSVYQPELDTTDIENSEARPQITNQHGFSGQFDWNLAGYTLTSISAYRYQDFDIKNGGQYGPFYISNSGQQLWNTQWSQELRLASPVAPGQLLDYQVGLYYLNAEVYSDDPTYYGEDAGAWYASSAQYTTLIATGAGRELLRASLDGMYQSSVTDARVQSLAGYGQTNLHLTDRATLSLGLRQTQEKKQNRIRQELDRAGEDLDALGASLGATAAEIAAAEAIRSKQITTAFDWVDGHDIDAGLTAWNLSPSYKLSDDIMLYASAGQGVKSGFIYFQQQTQPTDSGFETDIKPEKSFDIELGIKTLLWSRRLQLNANLYRTRVTDYQASWIRENPDDPSTTISGWGNAPKVLAEGLEVESALQLTKALSISANGAYNRATYEAQWLVQTPESATTTYFDARGNQIAGVPKITANADIEYELPLCGHALRLNFSNAYRSGTYLSDNHAAFTYQKAYNVSNLGVGFGAQNHKWELSLLYKNVFDTEYAYTKSTWTSSAGQTLTLGDPRALTVSFRSRL